jgi:hypothetical protein
MENFIYNEFLEDLPTFSVWLLKKVAYCDISTPMVVVY